MPTSDDTQSTSGQVANDFNQIPWKPHGAENKKEPQERFTSHSQGSGCALTKERHVEFVKTAKSEATGEWPELQVPEGLK